MLLSKGGIDEVGVMLCWFFFGFCFFFFNFPFRFSLGKYI